MHIFPFAETVEEATAAAGPAKAKATFYALLIIPQEGFHGKLASKDPRSGGPTPIHCTSRVTVKLIWHAEVPALFKESIPLGNASKFLLTSSSDRSPPAFA